ncbi:MAG: UDP-4-amino-4,6-dideoxy-N-acetyl-beta-L-altrosamine N-acetyltransferase [Pseudomonadota bacterium]
MLIPLTDVDLELIRQWRNQVQVRKFFFNDHLISKQEHLNWWQNTKDDGSKKWLLFSQNGEKAGVVYFYDIQSKAEAFWGFYFSSDIKDYEKLKLWFALEQYAMEYAFNELQLQQLKCEVFAFNKAALVMHKRFAYKQIDSYQHSKGEVIILEIDKQGVKQHGK